MIVTWGWRFSLFLNRSPLFGGGKDLLQELVAAF
jgi:hypothetical protein